MYGSKLSCRSSDSARQEKQSRSADADCYKNAYHDDRVIIPLWSHDVKMAPT